jgi:hypothetical protein
LPIPDGYSNSCAYSDSDACPNFYSNSDLDADSPVNADDGNRLGWGNSCSCRVSGADSACGSGFPGYWTPG